MSAINTINVHQQVKCIWSSRPGGAGQTTKVTGIQIINLDTSNTVYVGNSTQIMYGSVGVPLGPLASMSFDNTQSIYAVTNGPNVDVGVVPSGTAYSAGELNITGNVTANITGLVDVSITGANTIDVTGNVDVIGQGGYISPGQIATMYNNPGVITVGAGQTNTLINNAAIGTYTSLDFAFSALANSSAAAGSAMCMVVTFNWLDTNGNFIGIDRISICQGQSVVGRIPCQGSNFIMTVSNPGTVGNLTFPIGEVVIDGSYRTVNKLTFSTTGYSAPTFAGLVIVPPVNPLYQINGWIANLVNLTGLVVADTYMVLLPMFYGQVNGNLSVSTNALSNNAAIIDLSYAVVGGVSAGANNNGMIQNIGSGIANTPLTFNMPPSQCALILKASNVATSVYCSLQAMPS